MSCNHQWSKECYDVVPSQVCVRCNAFQVEEEHAELVRERDEARAEAASSLAMARIADEKHGWKCAEVDMLRGVGCMEDGDGPCGACRKCAYRRGAEAMREACAGALLADGLVLSRERAAKVVRALPIPEEP